MELHRIIKRASWFSGRVIRLAILAGPLRPFEGHSCHMISNPPIHYDTSVAPKRAPLTDTCENQPMWTCVYRACMSARMFNRMHAHAPLDTLLPYPSIWRSCLLRGNNSLHTYSHTCSYACMQTYTHMYICIYTHLCR